MHANQKNVTTVFTYSHLNTPIDQEESTDEVVQLFQNIHSMCIIAIACFITFTITILFAVQCFQ